MNYIYTITNKITGEVYVGQTVNVGKRFYLHRRTLREDRHCNPYLQRSYNKYGSEAFAYLIVEECDNYDIANIIEDRRITELRANRIQVYNLRQGGRNGKLSEEHKRKIGDANRGKKHTVEARRKMSAWQKGRKQSKETIRKRVAARSWYKPTPKHRQKMSKIMTGKTWSEESKAKIKGRTITEEAKAKMSAAKKGKPWTEARRKAQCEKSS